MNTRLSLGQHLDMEEHDIRTQIALRSICLQINASMGLLFLASGDWYFCDCWPNTILSATYKSIVLVVPTNGHTINGLKFECAKYYQSQEQPVFPHCYNVFNFSRNNVINIITFLLYKVVIYSFIFKSHSKISATLCHIFITFYHYGIYLYFVIDWFILIFIILFISLMYTKC